MSTRITLYGAAVTPYTIKVARALQWKGLPFALEEPQSAEDYRRWSPANGLLPVLDLGGTRVQDSTAILDLLEQRYPEPPLLLVRSEGRARAAPARALGGRDVLPPPPPLGALAASSARRSRARATGSGR